MQSYEELGKQLYTPKGCLHKIVSWSVFFPLQWLYIALHFINETKHLETDIREKALLSAFTALSSLFETFFSTQTLVI